MSRFPEHDQHKESQWDVVADDDGSYLLLVSTRDTRGRWQTFPPTPLGTSDRTAAWDEAWRIMAPDLPRRLRPGNST